MGLPKDPVMLASVINMRLRDGAADIDDICGMEDIDKDELLQKLSLGGFYYDEKHNCFLQQE